MKKLLAAFLLLSACSLQPTFTPDQSFETMINQSRGKLTPLSWSATLQAAADLHSNHMDSTGFYSHTWQDGTTLKDRLLSVGYKYDIGAENIAWGHKTESDVLQGWLDSPPHRDAILFGYYNRYGLSHKGIYWTLVLGYEYVKEGK